MKRTSLLVAVAFIALACSGTARATPAGGPVVAGSPATSASTAPRASVVVTLSTTSVTIASTPSASAPQVSVPDSAMPEPLDSGGSTTGGDIPDNAVFLVYHDQAHAFSIKYVEGWQVTRDSDGVVIRDKDSSETVQVVPAVSDVPSYISGTDLPQLRAVPGFQLDKQDTVNVNGAQLNHLVYHAPSPPDPVTGKEVASTIDRYYVAGATGLAIVTLSTPDGVDNVDAFREMIKSFVWD